MVVWTQRSTPSTIWELEAHPIVDGTNGLIGFDIAVTGSHLAVSSSTGAISGVETTKRTGVGGSVIRFSGADTEHFGWIGAKI